MIAFLSATFRFKSTTVASENAVFEK